MVVAWIRQGTCPKCSDNLKVNSNSIDNRTCASSAALPIWNLQPSQLINLRKATLEVSARLLSLLGSYQLTHCARRGARSITGSSGSEECGRNELLDIASRVNLKIAVDDDEDNNEENENDEDDESDDEKDVEDVKA